MSVCVRWCAVQVAPSDRFKRWQRLLQARDCSSIGISSSGSINGSTRYQEAGLRSEKGSKKREAKGMGTHTGDRRRRLKGASARYVIRNWKLNSLEGLPVENQTLKRKRQTGVCQREKMERADLSRKVREMK